MRIIGPPLSSHHPWASLLWFHFEEALPKLVTCSSLSRSIWSSSVGDILHTLEFISAVLIDLSSSIRHTKSSRRARGVTNAMSFWVYSVRHRVYSTNDTSGWRYMGIVYLQWHAWQAGSWVPDSGKRHHLRTSTGIYIPTLESIMFIVLEDTAHGDRLY